MRSACAQHNKIVKFRKPQETKNSPATGTWFIIRSSNPDPFQPIIQLWGQQGDVPVPGDYDGDGIADCAI